MFSAAEDLALPPCLAPASTLSVRNHDGDYDVRFERETWGSTLNRSYRIKNRLPIIGHGVCCVASSCCLTPLFVTDQLVAQKRRARHAAASWAELRSISERPTTPPSLRRPM